MSYHRDRINFPLITAIITTYRRPHLLKRAIESLQRQTYPFFEICIYDNASGDETSEIVAAFQKRDPRIKYHCHPANLGMMGNYQYAFSRVNTPFFSFLSDDDVVLPNFCETLLKGFQEHPDAMFVSGSVIVANEKKNVLDVSLDGWIREGYFQPIEGAIQMIGRWLPPVGILFRREVLKEVSISMENPVAWDCDFLLQISTHHPFYVVKKPCAIFLRHDEAFSASQSSRSWCAGVRAIIENMKKKSDVMPAVRDALVAHLSRNEKEYALFSARDALYRDQLEVLRGAIDLFYKDYGHHWQATLLRLFAKNASFFKWGRFLILFFRWSKYLSRRRKRAQNYEQILHRMFG